LNISLYSIIIYFHIIFIDAIIYYCHWLFDIFIADYIAATLSAIQPLTAIFRYASAISLQSRHYASFHWLIAITPASFFIAFTAVLRIIILRFRASLAEPLLYFLAWSFHYSWFAIAAIFIDIVFD